MEKMGLSESRRAEQEQWVVRLCRLLGHRKARRVREPVARADHEAVERVTGIEVGPRGLPPTLTETTVGGRLCLAGIAFVDDLDAQRAPCHAVGRAPQELEIARLDPLPGRGRCA